MRLYMGRFVHGWQGRGQAELFTQPENANNTGTPCTKSSWQTEPDGHKKEDFLHRDRHNRTAAGKKHNALLKNCKIIQNFLIKES
jgi:hypothetical protein